MVDVQRHSGLCTSLLAPLVKKNINTSCNIVLELLIGESHASFFGIVKKLLYYLLESFNFES